GERLGRYSFIGVAPRVSITCADGTAVIAEDRATRRVPYTDPLVLLRTELARFHRAPAPDMPRFSGGAVGYVGYEAARRFEKLPLAERDVYGMPEMVMGIYDTVVVFDHVRHTVLVLAHDERGAAPRAEASIAKIFAALDAPLEPL